jgi:ribulose 1,5-bisphosphate synthetase/thiazole synthase
MLADATGDDRAGFARTFDVCVVGAGPAGITLARRLPRPADQARHAAARQPSRGALHA